MKTTFRSKLALAALMCLFAGGVAHATATASATATAPTIPPAVVSNATDADHIALAKAYVEVSGIEDDIKTAVEEMSARVTPDQRVLFRSIADKTIDFTKLKSGATVQIANQFTDAEIKAMTKFYSSDEGKSIRKKLPAYEASMQPTVVEVLQNFVMKLKENSIAVDTTGMNGQ